MTNHAAILVAVAAWLTGTPQHLHKPVQKSNFHNVMKIHKKRCSRKRRK